MSKGTRINPLIPFHDYTHLGRSSLIYWVKSSLLIQVKFSYNRFGNLTQEKSLDLLHPFSLSPILFFISWFGFSN